MTFKIVYFPVSEGSQYIKLVTSALPQRYGVNFIPKADLGEIIEMISRGEQLILHIQWEEFALKRCKSADEADAIARSLGHQLKHLKRLGARIAWTVHNGIPHQIAFVQAFIQLRRSIAAAADIVLIHNQASADFLEAQIGLDRARLHLLRHPSYLGFFEPEEVTLHPPAAQTDRTILGFGLIRDQKGFDQMIEMLPPDFLRQHGAAIRIVGGGRDSALFRARHTHRTDITFDLGYFPDADVPGLLRSIACIVLPYQRLLTSGVAHLAATYGTAMVAPDVVQFRELVPETARSLLFRAGDADDFRRAVVSALDLDPAARSDLASKLQSRALELHPRAISGDLVAIYDRLAQRKGREAGLWGRLFGTLQRNASNQS